MSDERGEHSAASFGQWVRARRIALLLTQEELAERSGLSVRTVRNLESGRGGAPRLETRRLATAALEALESSRATAEPDEGIAARPAVAGLRPTEAVPPAQLPLAVAGFVGRVDELRRLDALLDGHGAGEGAPVVISAIAGMAGVGKTALAVHWAHRVRDRFTDGQLYVDLRGYAPGAEPLRPIDALARFLRALDVPTERVPTDVEVAAALYRTLVADRRLLVLLDNARDPAQVRPLLPGGAGNLVLITSRDHLDGLIAREGATRITMGAFSPDEARSMVERVLGGERVVAEPDAAVDLVELCARLPLALRIAATNIGVPGESRSDSLGQDPHGGSGGRIARYVTRLRADLLDELAVPGDPECVVRAAFELSYVALPAPARRLFRRLGLVPGPDLTVETAAVVAELGPAEAAGLMDRLADAHLLERRAPERFACHDLLRLYARERAGAEGGEPEGPAVRDRLYGHYLDRVGAAAAALYPNLLRLPSDGGPPAAFDDPADASAWLEAEHANLVAAVVHAAEYGPRTAAWRLADGLRGHFMHRMLAVDWLACARAGLAAAEAESDLCGQSAARLSLATLHARLGDQGEAIAGYTRARELARTAGWVDGEVAALGSLGNVYMRQGRSREAAANLAEVVAHARRSGKVAVLAAALSNLGSLSVELGRLHEAADQYAEALALARQVGSANLEANSLANLGEAYHALGEYDLAADRLSRALALHQHIGDRDSESFTLCHLAAVERERGDLDEALRLAERALELACTGGNRRYEIDARNGIGTIHHRRGEPARAAESHQAALDLARATGYRYATAIALLGRAEARRSLGDPAGARDDAEEARRIAAAGGYRLLLKGLTGELSEKARTTHR